MAALFVLRLAQDAFALRVVSGGDGFTHSGALPHRKDALMNTLYTAAEENRLAAAAMAEARRLRALAPAEFWSAASRWACKAAGQLTRGLVGCVRTDGVARPQAK